MLNKDICKRCLAESFPLYPPERDWENGWFCPLPCLEFKRDESKVGHRLPEIIIKVRDFVTIEDGPPENCHYLVEQFLYHDATKEEADVE